MKNKLFSGIAALLMMIGIASCGGNNTTPIEEGKIFFTTQTLEMEKYDSTKIDYELINLEGTLTWTTADSSVAIVYDDGIVEGKGIGITTITATLGKATATCTVTVNENKTAPVIVIEKTSVNLLTDSDPYENELYVTYKGFYVSGVTFKFTYYDVPNDVIKCEYAFNHMVITPLKAGSTVVTISTVCYETTLVETVSVVVAEA